MVCNFKCAVKTQKQWHWLVIRSLNLQEGIYFLFIWHKSTLSTKDLSTKHIIFQKLNSLTNLQSTFMGKHASCCHCQPICQYCKIWWPKQSKHQSLGNKYNIKHWKTFRDAHDSYLDNHKYIHLLKSRKQNL